MYMCLPIHDDSSIPPDLFGFIAGPLSAPYPLVQPTANQARCEKAHEKYLDAVSTQPHPNERESSGQTAAALNETTIENAPFADLTDIFGKRQIVGSGLFGCDSGFCYGGGFLHGGGIF